MREKKHTPRNCIYKGDPGSFSTWKLSIRQENNYLSVDIVFDRGTKLQRSLLAR